MWRGEDEKCECEGERMRSVSVKGEDEKCGCEGRG